MYIWPRESALRDSRVRASSTAPAENYKPSDQIPTEHRHGNFVEIFFFYTYTKCAKKKNTENF